MVEFNQNITKESCVCINCEKEFKNGIDKEEYVPRWQAQCNTFLKCIAWNCDNTSISIHKAVIATADQVAEIFDIEPGISDITLCTEHYKIVHRHIHSNDSMYYSVVKCKMCQALIHGIVGIVQIK